VRSSAIRRGCTNTIRTILRRTGADADGGQKLPLEKWQGENFPTSSF
jgi:hypothetical protein